ncbi:ZmpA/ZmpB/ZmpC family metallo-endopeptidase [uncultured Gemella sp.]|uniref:ZmpA/ZmpB/ZmpC family metallo-endopeptidase n=1 Tax=uncultured Gemella sp. TaxID=254352 RepID=UPI0028D78BDB|nr:ZmpA/ZmpB/ZmpC family metallo-endopeptidase [uncultured Gemella sp.]
MTKKENFRRKQYFSIRKYKMGACSVLLGTSLFLSLSYTGEAKATEEKEVCIHAVDNSSLSEQIKSQLKVFEENKITVEEGKSYYFVYKKNNVLPSTGGVTSGTAVLGGALLLVCLTLIKKKKGKLIFLVSMLTVSGNLSQVMAFEDFREIQPTVIKTSIGGMLPSPEEIPGYSFTGHYFEIGKTCTNKSSSIKIEERGEFTPGLVEEKTGIEEKVVVSEKGEPLVQDENPEGVVSEKGEPLIQDENPEAVISEKGEPLVQPENPEGVVSEKGEPLVQPENPEGVVSEKGEPLVQDENPEAVISEKGEPLVQPEKPLASWNGPTLVREENPITEVSIKGESLVQPENPEYEITPTPEQPTPEVTPKPAIPVEKPSWGDIHDSKPDRPVRIKDNRKCPKPTADELKHFETSTIIINGKSVIPISTITTVEELDYKTIYGAGDPYDLNFRDQDEIVEGSKGTEVITTSYIRDESTGEPVEHISKIILCRPIDKVIEVGNVERIVKPIEITEERKEDPELPKGIELVREGKQGKTTITRTYEVNPETGELTNPVEKTEIAEYMIPRLILVGTKEDKPHLLPVNSGLENAVNVTEATAEMKNVDLLTNGKLKAQLTPSDIEINRDLFLKRKELQKTNPAITDEEVKEVLRKEYLEKLSIKETLEETKIDLDARLKKVAAHTLSIIGDTPQNREKVRRDIEANKEKILLGLSYINRFYNIDFGDTNIRDILAYNPSSFGKKNVTSLDWLTHLGSMSYDELKLTNSPKTFEKYFGKITDKPTLLDFLDYNRTTFTNMDGDTWLKKATKAIVVEKPSKQKPDEKVELYTKLTTSPEKYGAEELQIKNRRQQNIATLLGLVNIKEPSVYAITNMATVTYGNIGTYMDTSLEKANKAKYTEELNKVKELIELTATRQANYIDTLYRITKEENRPKLITNRVIVDTMKKYTPNEFAGIATTWSKESGPTADKGVKDFMTPLGLYSPSQNVGAEANGVGVRYFIDRVLDDRGSATYSHEMTHLLDRTVLFNNHGRRDGTAAEFYARGIFENSYTPEKDTYFNLNFVFDESNKNGFYNKTSNRFKTAADLRNYMHGSFDVLYSLDYLEAEATRKLSAEDKTKYFKKITPIASKGPRATVTYTNQAVKATHNSEKISEITLAEAEKLNDINSLIDNNILVNRYIINGFNAKGDVLANGYYFVDMFDTIFGVSENDKGMSGDITFRKQAFELMGALGYYEGFVPYVSNQFKQQAEAESKPLSDKYIFEKILGKTYAAFKKDQINERVAKLDSLKSITINYNGKQQVIDSKEKLQQLMNEAVLAELAQIKAGNTTAQKFMFIETPVQKLKKEIYKAYLRQSQDFTESIYKV